jgi:hypothetical protein
MGTLLLEPGGRICGEAKGRRKSVNVQSTGGLIVLVGELEARSHKNVIGRLDVAWSSKSRGLFAMMCARALSWKDISKLQNVAFSQLVVSS